MNIRELRQNELECTEEDNEMLKCQATIGVVMFVYCLWIYIHMTRQDKTINQSQIFEQ